MDDRGIELAHPRVSNDPVLQTVLRIARCERRLVEVRKLGGRHRCAGLREREASEHSHRLSRQRVHGRTRDNTVVVIWITLHLHQRLAPAGRAALEVGTLLRLPVIFGNDRLACRRHHVNGAMSEIIDGCGASRPCCIPNIGSFVAAVRLRGRVAFRKSRRSSLEVHVAGPAAATEPKQLAIPVVRQAIHDADVRSLHRRNDRSNFAERGSLCGIVGSNLFRTADLGIWNGGRGELGALGLARRRERRCAAHRPG